MVEESDEILKNIASWPPLLAACNGLDVVDKEGDDEFVYPKAYTLPKSSIFKPIRFVSAALPPI